MGNPLWSIFWFLVLIFLGFAVSVLCAYIYILIYPLTVCMPGLQGLCDFLLIGIQFTHYCSKAMVDGHSLC